MIEKIRARLEEKALQTEPDEPVLGTRELVIDWLEEAFESMGEVEEMAYISGRKEEQIAACEAMAHLAEVLLMWMSFPEA